MKKFNLFAIGVVAMLMAAVNVSAANTDYFKVEDWTQADTVTSGTGTLTPDNQSKEVTLTYSAGAFKAVLAGEDDSVSEGRPEGYAWVGVKLTAPAGAKDVVINGKTTKLETEGSDKVTYIFEGFKASNLRDAAMAGKNFERVITISWKNADDVAFTQTVTISVDPENVTYNNGTDDRWLEGDYEELDKANPLVTIHVGSDSTAIANKVNGDTITFRVEKDSVLDKTTLDKAVNAYLVEKGYALDAYYDNGTTDAFDFTTKVKEGGIELTMYVKTGTTEPTPVDPEPTDDPTPVDPTPTDPTPENPGTTDGTQNPDTLDNVTSVAAMGGISLAIAAAGIATLKKREN